MSQIQLFQGDCLEILKKIPDQSIDAVIADPPYGTTACKWDSIIPLEPMWEQLKRVIKQNGAIALFGAEPFSSHLRLSNIAWYKYDWIWKKSQGCNFAQSNFMPLKNIEIISVFGEFGLSKNSKIQAIYNPQGIQPANITKTAKTSSEHRKSDKNYSHVQKFQNYPEQLLEFRSERGLHPTQKPVSLMEYLIKTYTNKDEAVLDFTMGSGSTGVACVNTGRNFIGIELDENYFEIAQERIHGSDSLAKRRNHNVQPPISNSFYDELDMFNS